MPMIVHISLLVFMALANMRLLAADTEDKTDKAYSIILLVLALYLGLYLGWTIHEIQTWTR